MENQALQWVIHAPWSRNRAGESEDVYSHQTAVSIHGLYDLNPVRLQITFPVTFRRTAKTASVPVLHRSSLIDNNIDPRSGTRLTVRTETVRQEEGAAGADRRTFYDFTFSPPKSVSIAALVGGDESNIEFHHWALKLSLEELERFVGTQATKWALARVASPLIGCVDMRTGRELNCGADFTLPVGSIGVHNMTVA